MMKNNNMIRRISGIVLAAVTTAVMTAPVVAPALTGHAAEVTPIAAGNARSVELGIGALVDPVNGGGEWNGTHVYFGNQGNYPISFRVLDTDSTAYGGKSVLLDADYAISRRAFDDYGSSNWADSGLRGYLNNEFLMGNFSQTERDAILQSVKNGADAGSSLNGDYIFVLDQQEAQNPEYGYGETGALVKENMRFYQTDATYALRSVGGNGIQTVDPSGSFSSASPSDKTYYSPALNIDAGSIAFTYPAEEDKPAYLAPVGMADDNYFKLTMKGGSGFSATRKDSENNAVPAGYGFLVDVGDMGVADKGVNYSQISGMLVDAQGNAVSYGMLSEIAATGEVLVNIPFSVEAGDYTLYVFAEDVKSDHYDHATDYASNFAPIKVRVSDGNAVSEEAQSSIEQQNQQKTEQAQKQKTDTQQNQQDQKKQEQQQNSKQKQDSQKTQPQAVAHKITLSTDGHGTVTAPLQQATVGTVITLSAKPDKDYHFKEWQSNEVKVANDNKFTMPDKDVTVKAVFEKNNNEHAIKLAEMHRSTVELSATHAAKGTKITAKCKPKTGYHFVKWNQDGLTNNLKNENPISFIMPDNDVELQAVCEPDEVKEYTISVKVSGQGSASAAYSKAKPNVWVNISANPASGWRFLRWDSKEVNPGGQNKFLMPSKNVTLTAVFEKIPESNYSVSTITRGDGGQLWTTAENGTPKTSFVRGEKVIVQTKLENKYRLNSLKAEGVDLTRDSRTGATYFYMPAKNVTLTAVFEREAEQEHEAYLIVSGNGSAWTQNARGENVRYFKEGERVNIQTMSHNAELDSIQSRDVTVNVDKASESAWFNMPKGGATVYVSFKDVESEYEAYLNVSGNGSAWTTDKNGNTRRDFKAGERVLIQTMSNEAELKSITSNDVSIGKEAGCSGYFDMPRGGATISIVFENAAPKPAQTYSVLVRSSGDGSGWVTDEDGDARSSFEAGERVYIQTVHNSSEIRSITSDNVTIQGGSGNNDGYFDMPAGNVTIDIAFTTEARDYSVSVASVSGPGSVYTIGGDGASKSTFREGDTVTVVLNGEDVTWDGYSSDDPYLSLSLDGRGRLIFTMPDHNVQLWILTRSTASAPEPEADPEPSREQQPASVATVGDDGDSASTYDDLDDFDDPDDFDED